VLASASYKLCCPRDEESKNRESCCPPLLTIVILEVAIELALAKDVKDVISNLMSYSPAPVVWGRDNLRIGGCYHFLWRQFG
jgi:hypothetical protein